MRGTRVPGLSPLYNMGENIMITAQQARNTVRQEHHKIRYMPGQHKIPRVWIMLADRRTAKIFSKDSAQLVLMEELKADPMDFPKGYPNHAIGRVISACSGFVRHKLEPRKAPGEEEALAFARQLAHRLEELAHEGRFDRLILVAAPAMLGNLRKTFSKRLHAVIGATAARDLTKTRDDRLYGELKKIVRF